MAITDLSFKVVAILFSAFLSTEITVAQVVPLTNAHAHNDYWHFCPLKQAMNNGFCSVEADVHLVKGRVLVAHEHYFTKRRRSLEKLYLAPLSKAVKSNNGRVYPGFDGEFELMIDLKTSAPELLDSINAILAKYQDMLTIYENGKLKQKGAVRVILSGAGSKYMIANDSVRYCSVDGGLADSTSQYGSDVIARVSANYNAHFKWKGKGLIPESEKQLMRKLAEDAHRKGQKIRFWACGNNPKVWKELRDAGVDWINVDRLNRFRRFMSRN